MSIVCLDCTCHDEQADADRRGAERHGCVPCDVGWWAVSGLTDAEREVLWESIERAFLDTTTFDRPSEDAIDATVERIIAARLAEQAEQIAQAIEAQPEHDGDGWPVRAYEAKADAASIARNHGATP